jgi:hypothetical protein
MQPIPAALQTLYLDLAQQAQADAPASVYVANIKGKQYLKADERHGAARITRHLGPADDDDVQRLAGRYRAGQQAAKSTRKLVQALRDAGIAAPPRNMGRVLEVLAAAHLFESGGVVLVGTVAYILYSAALGVYLPSNLMATQDVDLSIVSVAIKRRDPVDLGAILKRADPTFGPKFNRNHASNAPTTFAATDGLLVETLTNYRRGGNPVAIPELKSAAVALAYQDYLVESPERFVALYGSGVPVLAPRPARYAVHKLIVATSRPESARAKRAKDLMQAKALFEAVEPDFIQDALDDAIGRGGKWKTAVEKGLKLAGL